VTRNFQKKLLTQEYYRDIINILLKYKDKQEKFRSLKTEHTAKRSRDSNISSMNKSEKTLTNVEATLM